MEKLHGKYLVAGAVFSLVVSFTSATAVAATNCTTGGSQCATASIANSHCDASTLKCKCNITFKEDPEGTCAPRALGDACTAGANAECGGVTNAECQATANVCACPVQYKTGTNTCTLRGLTDSCTAENECSGVSNAECAGETGKKVCTCKAEFKPADGQCNTANGLQTLLTAPAALLLSLLTMVVTRLH